MERHSNPKSICTKQQRCKIYEAKLIELQGGKDKSTSTVGDVNNSQNNYIKSAMYKGYRRTQQHHHPRESHQNLQSLPPTTTEYIFLSSTHGTYTKIDQILAHKTNLKKLTKIYIQSVFSDHSGIMPGMSNRNIAGKSQTYAN